MKDEALWTKPFILALLASFLIFIPYSLYLPVLPLYVLNGLHGSPATAGLVNALFLLASVLFRAQTSRLEGMFGTRKVLLGSVLLFMLSSCLFLLTDTLMMVLLIRFFGGACFAVANTCINAMGSRIAPLKRKGEGLGYLTMVVTAGNAIGPFIGLNLARSCGFDSVFLFCAASVAAGFLLSLMIAIPDEAPSGRRDPPGPGLKELFEVRATPASTVILLLSVAHATVLTFVTVHATSLHLGTAAAWFFVVLAGCSMVSRMFTGRIFDRFGANVVIYPSIALMALGMLTLGCAATSTHMLAAAALLGLSYGTAVPALLTLAFQHSPPRRTSAITATYFTFLDIGLGCGSYLVGACIPCLGHAGLYLLLSPFILAVALLHRRLDRSNGLAVTAACGT